MISTEILQFIIVYVHGKRTVTSNFQSLVRLGQGSNP